VDKPGAEDPILMGIMAEILSEKFHALNMDVHFLELLIQQPPESEQRAKFWLDLKGLVEPRNPEYMTIVHFKIQINFLKKCTRSMMWQLATK